MLLDRDDQARDVNAGQKFHHVIDLSMLNPPPGGGGGGGSGYPRGFDCEVCRQGGDFDRTTYPQRGEFDMATILDNEEGFEIKVMIL